mgnify:CR=1 FL=1
MPDEAPAPPDRLDRSIVESHRLMTKRLLDQARTVQAVSPLRRKTKGIRTAAVGTSESFGRPWPLFARPALSCVLARRGPLP